MINTGRRPCNYDRLDSARDAGCGDATRFRQTGLDVLVSWMNTAGFLPHQKRVAHYPQEYLEVRRLPVLSNVVSATVTLHHLGLQPATLSQCVSGFQQECKRTEAVHKDPSSTSDTCELTL